MSDEARVALAAQALALLAVDPLALRGVVLRAPSGETRDAFLAALRDALAADRTAPIWRRLPPGTPEGRLLGGLDLAATLAAGRPVTEPGLFAEAAGGILVVPMAERLSPGVAGLLAAALDQSGTTAVRDGESSPRPAAFCALILDESEGDESVAAALVERVGPIVDLRGLRHGDIARPVAAEIAAARARLADVETDDAVIEALVAAGSAFGVASLRCAGLALRAARAAAALAGRRVVAREDAEVAAALVIAPRATRLPTRDEAPDDDPPAAEPPEDETSSPEPETPEDDAAQGETSTLADSVVEATRAAVPADLLALIGAGALRTSRTGGGRGGAATASPRRGRAVGSRRGQPGHGARLALVETLRAAAPWQPLRRAGQPDTPADRLLVRREDFRIARLKAHREHVTIFVVDASGSAALHRLAEVKGAVELILAECYVRRDGVALIAFRGSAAELILPPTRSLARAKRALAGQPGGGGTPLASALDLAQLVAARVRREGREPLVVLLTDGKANIARSGAPGRAAAEADAQEAARAFRTAAVPAILLDIAPRASETAGRLAASMGARYIPLPYADAQAMSQVVRAAAPVARSNV